MNKQRENKLVAMSDESFSRLRWGLSAASAALASAMVMVLESAT